MENKCCVCSNKSMGIYNKKYYCGKHLMQMKRHNKILNRTRFDKNIINIAENYAEIFLYDKNGKIVNSTKIDMCNIEKCSRLKWHLSYRGNKKYVFSRINGKQIRLHRYLLDASENSSLEVDHIDGNTLNNRLSNLRLCTHQENMMNQRVLPSNNTSGCIGVYFDKKLNKWISQIKINKRHIHLGVFTKFEDAKQNRLEAEKIYFGNNKFINYE